MKKTLLIVEDNLILCDILERWLQKAGYRVLTAIDEPSARRKICLLYTSDAADE